MSKLVAQSVIRGAHEIFKQASDFLDKAVKEKGPEQKIGFPETAFYLPMANALLGAKVEKLKAEKTIIKDVLQSFFIPSNQFFFILTDYFDAFHRPFLLRPCGNHAAVARRKSFSTA